MQLQVLLKSLRVFLAILLLAGIVACTPPTSQQPSVSQSVATAPLAQASSPSRYSSPDAGQQAAIQVVRNYYDAINHQDYRRAYEDWANHGAASNQSFDQFKQGFADTASVSVEIGEPGRVEGAAGSLYIEVPVTITATTVSGSTQRFKGSYNLRRVNNIPGATLNDRTWHLYSANIVKASAEGLANIPL
jgi:hypothetical protein